MTNSKNPKIISFAAIKGGVGKTTLSYNFGEWLANRGNSVLFIDLDHQCNLSHTYDIYDNETNIGNIFTKKGKVKIHKITDKISIIGGNLYLDDIQANIQTLPDKNMLLYMWMYDNARLGKNAIDENCVTDFDYIIIDCHPDFMTATKNALIVSDNVLSPLIPSEFGYDAQNDFNERFTDFKNEAVDYRTRESYVTAKTMFLGNLIEHNTKESQEFIDVTKSDNSVIALIPKKQLFVKTTKDKTSLSKMKNNHDLYVKQHPFFDNIEQTFAEIDENLIKSV